MRKSRSALIADDANTQGVRKPCKLTPTVSESAPVERTEPSRVCFGAEPRIHFLLQAPAVYGNIESLTQWASHARQPKRVVACSNRSFPLLARHGSSLLTLPELVRFDVGMAGSCNSASLRTAS